MANTERLQYEIIPAKHSIASILAIGEVSTESEPWGGVADSTPWGGVAGCECKIGPFTAKIFDPLKSSTYVGNAVWDHVR